MAFAYLSLGSNIDAVTNLTAAVAELRGRFAGVVVSRAYRTPAVGFAGADFVNAAVRIDTDLARADLTSWLRAVEDVHHRDRTAPKFGDRTLDVDIVLYDDETGSEPWLRADALAESFVLKPLAEIGGDVKVPGAGGTLRDLWERHPDRDIDFEVVRLG